VSVVVNGGLEDLKVNTIPVLCCRSRFYFIADSGRGGGGGAGFFKW